MQPDRRRRDGVRRHVDQLLCRKLKLLGELDGAARDERAQLQVQIAAIDEQVARLVAAVRGQALVTLDAMHADPLADVAASGHQP